MASVRGQTTGLINEFGTTSGDKNTAYQRQRRNAQKHGTSQCKKKKKRSTQSHKVQGSVTSDPCLLSIIYNRVNVQTLFYKGLEDNQEQMCMILTIVPVNMTNFVVHDGHVRGPQCVVGIGV